MTINAFKCEVFFFFFLLLSPPAVSFMITSLYGLFLQQLAWIRRSVRNELEAESRSGQLLFFTEPQSPSTQLWFSTQSLKKTKGMPSFGQLQSGQVDFMHFMIITMTTMIVMCVGDLVRELMLKKKLAWGGFLKVAFQALEPTYFLQ